MVTPFRETLGPMTHLAATTHRTGAVEGMPPVAVERVS